jgi:AcrR family transcriptional regulator
VVAVTKFTEDDILDAAEQVIAAAGVDAASIAAIARAAGAPNGSIYHRFPSRKHLLGALWVRIATSYRITLTSAVSTLTSDPTKLAETVVKHTFAWVDTNPSRAELLMRFRTEDFVPGDWPQGVLDQIEATNAALANDLLQLAGQLKLHPLDVILALVDIPATAARRSLLLRDPAATAHLQHRAIQLSHSLLNPEQPTPRKARR